MSITLTLNDEYEYTLSESQWRSSTLLQSLVTDDETGGEFIQDVEHIIPISDKHVTPYAMNVIIDFMNISPDEYKPHIASKSIPSSILNLFTSCIRSDDELFELLNGADFLGVIDLVQFLFKFMTDRVIDYYADPCKYYDSYDPIKFILNNKN